MRRSPCDDYANTLHANNDSLQLELDSDRVYFASTAQSIVRLNLDPGRTEEVLATTLIGGVVQLRGGFRKQENVLKQS
ncbi:hypothetical protein AC579_4218 [Pseudocercospora musae]|uniref:Uncharacterized protein n=1 Tax=Pseudocercospora musae TaxID=113226 RepID=A0A139IDF2_9PEZI|nr:hypothetical protein AC579_4218 [Pseudocercospora musae]